MLYSAPPLTLIGAGFVPTMVMGLDTWVAPRLEPETGVKPGCCGGWAAVVTVNEELTPPIVTIADEVVLYPEAAVICTTT